MVNIPIPDDFAALDAEAALNAITEITAALVPIHAALEALRVIATAPRVVEEAAAAYLDARDGTEPDPAAAEPGDYPPYWQPSGAHDAYPAGRIIRDADGQLWEARRSGVAHPPAEAPEEWARVWLVDGTISLTPPETPTPAWPAWDAATAYRRGDEAVMVTHKGRLWELVHTNADPGWEPGGVGMHAVWADRGPVGGGDDA